MTRRHLLLALPWLVCLRARLRAQSIDPDFVRDWDAAQQQRPADITTAGRLVPKDEPGTPLIIEGRIVQPDGSTPVARAVVFAYQTDTGGRYNRPGQRGWRLQGWARTDADGRFRFTTIRPGPYPGRQVAAHVHLGVDGPVGQRHLLPDLLFADDPLLTAAERQQSQQRGAFANIRPVRRASDGLRVDIAFRLPGDWRF